MLEGIQSLLLNRIESATACGDAVWIKTAPDAAACFLNQEVFRFRVAASETETAPNLADEFQSATAIRGEIRGLYFLWIKEGDEWLRVQALVARAVENQDDCVRQTELAVQKLVSDLNQYAKQG